MRSLRGWMVACLALASAWLAASAWTLGAHTTGIEFSLAGADLAFLGEKENDWSAYSVAPAGDVNNDGYADLLVGAPYAGLEPEKGPGKAYLMLGRPRSQWPTTHINLLDADASFLGPKPRVMAGRQLYTAGDVNGDGYDDFLITCWRCGMKGVTWLYLGRQNVDWGSNFSTEGADARFFGEDSLDRAGYYAATAGDVNGDGYDDFVITAVGDEDGGGFRAGQTYLLLGRAEANWGLDFSLTYADASFVGEAEGDASGRSAAGAGDVNGDGLDDFLIGAPFNDESNTDAGQVYLILGRAAADWGMRYPLAQADASFLGEGSLDQLGRRVSGAGDVNGDGYADLILGASYNDQAAPDAGKAYLLLGSANADWGADFPVAGSDASFLGEAEGDQAGRRVSEAGDLNRDGCDDFIIGAPHNSRAATEAGAAYLIYGRRAANWGLDMPLSQADIIYVGEAAFDHAGYDIAPLGDMDGDRVDDLVIGAYGADVNGLQSGETYVLYGSATLPYSARMPVVLRNH